MSKTLTKAEAAMHLETAPRHFARTVEDSHSSSHLQGEILKMAEGLTPKHAVGLAQTLLVHVYAQGIDYSDFQSAQAVEKYVGQAIRALRGLSLT
jgi:hypothetical protein